MPGPLQVIAVSFRPGSDFEDRVLDEVDRLQGRGVLRLLDMLFLAKDQDGTIEPVVLGGDDDDFGVLLSSIVPLAGGVPAESSDQDIAGFEPADAWALAESLEPGTGLAFLLIEHDWAQSLFETIADTGGLLLSEGFLTPEARLLVGSEVAAMEEAAEVIEEAHAAEARATLVAIAADAQAAEAVAEAADAVAASEAIQAAAAADAISALIAAGIVEEAAAHEAVEALRTAGLIVAAADEAVAEALDEDAALIVAADEATLEALEDDEAVVTAADQATVEALDEDVAVVTAADQATVEALDEDAAVVEAADDVTDDAVALAAATVKAASITAAEARVLRYLPTKLTFALIADKLGISRSAAKERAGRAYKKLGVHSRAEAVSRARALGLID